MAHEHDPDEPRVEAASGWMLQSTRLNRNPTPLGSVLGGALFLVGSMATAGFVLLLHTGGNHPSRWDILLFQVVVLGILGGGALVVVGLVVSVAYSLARRFWIHHDTERQLAQWKAEHPRRG